MNTEQAASPSLPDDIEALRAMVMALMTERDVVTRQLDAVTAERDTLLERNERVRSTGHAGRRLSRRAN